MTSAEREQDKKDISIILAIRNEEPYIRKCLDSLINQNFVHHRYEIIIIDGMSEDNTRNIIKEYQVKFPDLIRIFDNHKKIQSAGRNIGIKHSRGRAITVFDGHSYVDEEYLNILIRTLDNTPSDVVGFGGILLAAEDETLFGRIMSDVQSSIVGGAGASFRPKIENTYVESVPFGTYKKHVFEKTGLYDERFAIGEDMELNYRIREAGFRLMITPEIKIFYYRKHNSFRSFSVRMFRYGLWKALVVKKQPRTFKILFAIPTLLLFAVVLLPALLFFYSVFTEMVITGLLIYLLTVLTSSLSLTIKHRDHHYMISFLMYVIEHFSIGAGFFVGLIKTIPENQPSSLK